ncbi:hypothetical protein BJF92_11320 [Rhizobium rhizosphaerae]|uniref:Gene transfer agent family protein n=1 Tax=Xaviernesmea rhizosphaerae TaxID=1672749 RepID=A0A1Q9AMR1_9HYPH|nr:hypothetical protein [Xaviernesmea rhizosphaerae]OLP56671.1 hypothetical protein BJF92_11320 [Xaviernesmea rhizosphaerae]
MANREKGEVSFSCEGKTYTMKLGTGAMCAIEDATGKSIGEVGKALGNPETATLTMVRIVFWASLQGHHPGTSLADCDELIDEIGVSRAGELIGQAFQAAAARKSPDARPRTATAAP